MGRSLTLAPLTRVGADASITIHTTPHAPRRITRHENRIPRTESYFRSSAERIVVKPRSAKGLQNVVLIRLCWIFSENFIEHVNQEIRVLLRND